MNEQTFRFLQSLLFAIAAHRGQRSEIGLIRALELLYNSVENKPLETPVLRDALFEWAEYHAAGTLGEAIAAGLRMELPA